MDLSKDTWEIINSYFKDTENFLVKHHIDSYNDFIKNKIPLVFKNYNHQKVFRFDKENPDISYIANIYYGGKNANKYKISKPIIINHQNGENKQMYPNEARLKNLTYGFDFFFDVDVEFTIKKGDKIITMGGIYGTVQGFKEKGRLAVIKIDNNTNITINKTAIAGLAEKVKDAELEQA